ncbi:AbiV family abortive infection protein [Maribacter luteus]|uniref:AbiV family abortive infection protein n=1 Tax=Maribacter luteus TaxID=2594478 RepID=UPI00248FEE91|nr:AbiV family abortive infection protein [Maribacter luteus]
MQEVTFINLSKKDSKDLHLIIFENAKCLKSDSLLLSDINKSYSSASSLLILSSEEVIKAILVLLHSQGYGVYLLKDAKGFFKNHEIRHSLQMLIETGMSLFDTIDKWENRKLKKQYPNSKKKWLNNTLQFLSDAALLLSNVSKAMNRIEGIKKFNDLKNAGFYVDYKNEILIPNKIVVQEDYSSILETSNRLIIFYKQLRILFHPSITRHLSNDKIEEIKNGLHIFINDALKDFSFKEIKN